MTATATNAIATDTEAGAPDRRWRVVSLSGAVSAGSALLTVLSGATLKWQEIVAAGGPVSPNLGPGIQCEPGDAVTISLAAAGAGNVGTVNALVEMEG